jgi:hypothetical protein
MPDSPMHCGGSAAEHGLRPAHAPDAGSKQA